METHKTEATKYKKIRQLIEGKLCLLFFSLPVHGTFFWLPAKCVCCDFSVLVDAGAREGGGGFGVMPLMTGSSRKVSLAWWMGFFALLLVLLNS